LFKNQAFSTRIIMHGLHEITVAIKSNYSCLLKLLMHSGCERTLRYIDYHTIL